MLHCVKVGLVLGSCAGSEAFAPAASAPGLRLRSPAVAGPAAGRLAVQTRGDRLPPLRMGLFDIFKNALANEDLGAPPPDGLSQDPWLSGMRKSISVKFVKDGEVVAEGEALPGDKLADVAAKARVKLPETCMMKANGIDMQADGKDVQVSAATSRVPAPERRNLVTDGEDSEMMDSGLSAPVWTNFSQRGEVRTVKVEKKEYFVYL